MESVRVILNAVNDNNVELAQRTVDREVRKNPTSDVYLSLKVYVARHRGDRQTALDTAREAVKHASKKTMVMFLIPVLVAYNEPELLSAGFVRCNRLDPEDAEITEGWLESMLLLGDVSATQKALMATIKHAKKQRVAYYRACLVMALDKPNKIFPMLAGRMLEKYLPPLNPQEAYVAALVAQMTSTQKMVDFLRADEQRVHVDGSLELKLLLLEGLQQLEMWDDVYSFSENQLNQIDSYNYWQALNTAAKAANKVDKAREFNAKFSGNNALLARIDLATKVGEGQFEAVAGYWNEMSSKPSAYMYLKPYATADFVARLPHHQDLGTQINLAKLEEVVGKPRSTSQLLELYESHTAEVPEEPTDYFVGTDALLLVAARMLKDNGDFSREVAASVLEYALKRDPHQFYVRLLLVQIYMSLGTVHLAKSHFDSLSIRNIQLETLGYLLTSRLGSIAPLASKLVFDKMIMNYNRIPNFGTYSSAALSDGTFTRFDGIFQLGKKLRYSLGHNILLLEKLKASRIQRGTANYSDVDLIPEPTSLLLDNRDLTTSFDCEAANYCSTGPRQGAGYVEIQKRKELAFSQALRKAPVTTPIALDAVDASNELTEIEKWNVKAVTCLIKQESEIPDAPRFSGSTTDWEFYHWSYTLLETLKVSKDLKGSLPFNVHAAIRRVATERQAGMNAYEQAVLAAVPSDMPFDPSQTIRAIKKEHTNAISELLELIKPKTR